MKHFLLFLFIAAVQGSESKRFNQVIRIDKDNEAPNKTETTCFQFTWLADSNPQTFQPYLNKTCSDKFAKIKPMPLCVNPMVVTDNGNEPDMGWLLDHKPVICRLQEGYSCVKYTYRFNGKVQNVTRYCTKVTVDDSSMDEGCVVSDMGATQAEVCACTKMLGNTPCNGSVQFGLNLLLVCLTVFVINFTT